MIVTLEILGAIFTIMGSFLISRGKGDTYLYWGFASFITANVIMFAFSGAIGMMALQIQMVFFFILGIPVIVSTEKYKKNKKITDIFILSGVFISITLFLIVRTSEINYSFSFIEVIVAIMAVIGSYLQKYGKDEKIAGFIMFFIADAVYVYISIEKGLIFFGIQSFIFWYTSISGITNELKGESFKSWITRYKIIPIP